MATLFVLTAGLSTPSTSRQVADTVAEAVARAARRRGGDIATETVELRELATDLAHATTTGTSAPRLDEVRRRLSSADALVAVTPVFKASYSGLFKMFFDVLDADALNAMPTIIAATAGTARHSLVTEYALRPLLTFMRAVVVPTALFAATGDFGGPGSAEFSARVERAATELAELLFPAQADRAGGGGGAAGARPRKTGLDVTEDFVPFDQLLDGRTGTS
ncbi:CE1759 family FMN reductase [Corynebacterium sp. UBA2622]|uniref:CE1759 family FMN reductase n=1 Tax=Corynebacterium sp. UBA2622 TaxID=1946393 RepID=UPI0025C1E2BA|nr:CE1759 family FMN reductase [Corynebacterium sp. UBA2622]